MHNGSSAETMQIAYVVGARPNVVKMAPVIAELRRRIPDGRHVLIHAGRHYDRLISDVVLEDLGVLAPDHMLGADTASHAVQTARVMERIESILEKERPDVAIMRMHFVGNAMIDSLVLVDLLVTVHRPAFVHGPLLADVIAHLNVNRHQPVLFRVHPRTRRPGRSLVARPRRQRSRAASLSGYTSSRTAS